MKCKQCNGCLRLIRVDKPEVTKMFWVCMLCNKAYLFGTLREDDIDSEQAKINYKKLYGEQI